MAKKIITFLLLLTSAIFVFAQQTDNLIGTWKSEDGEKQLIFYKNTVGKFEAKSLKGEVMVKDLGYSNGKYTGGVIYVPKQQSWMKCSAVIKDGKTLQLTVTKGMFSKTVNWTKQ